MRTEPVAGRVCRRREARRLDDIVERFGRLPVLDEREPDDIIGYDAHGLPS